MREGGGRRRIGWVPRKSHPLSHADALHYPSFGLGRGWSPFLDHDLTSSPGFVHAVLAVEGSITFETDSTSTVASDGGVVLLDGAWDVRAVSTAPAARFSWYFAPSVLALDRALLPLGRTVALSEQPRNALVSATNALLNSPSELPPDAARYVGLSLAYLLAAGLADAQPSPPEGDPDGALVRRARAVVEQRFHDPDLTVERLARELNVSRSALHAAFAESDSTPRRLLEERRLQEARRLRVDGRLPSADIARLSGFSSATHLLRTLRRAEAKRPNSREENEISTT